MTVYDMGRLALFIHMIYAALTARPAWHVLVSAVLLGVLSLAEREATNE